MYKKIIKSFFLLLIISVFCFNFSLPCYAEEIDNVEYGNAYLAKGSVLTFKLMNDLDSNIVKKHDTIEFILLNDITVKDIVVIPKNTVLTGTVTKAHGSRIFGQSGVIRLRLNDYKLDDTHALHFNSDLKFKGGRNYANMAASVVVPFSGLLFKGKEVKYSAGTVIDYKLEDNLDLGIKEADLSNLCTAKK